MPPLWAVVWSAACALPALDALGRLLRLASFRPPAPRGTAPRRILARVPSRAEGARLLDLGRDLAR
jgi:hypothetical protein